MPLRPAVFLDRDGTINREVDYLADPALFELLPGVPAALRSLAAAGYALIVVTNQSGVARGLLDQTILDAIHARMVCELKAERVEFAAIESCPHHPDFETPGQTTPCVCRKPLPGMLHRAADSVGIDLQRSWMVGDSLRDLQAGHAAGTRSVLVHTGKGWEQSGAVSAALPDFQAKDISTAAARILAGWTA